MIDAAWSGSTAPTWDAGVLAGSGVAGGVLYGDPQRHVLALSHERFFVPANSRTPAPFLADVLPRVRAALASGDEKRAADVVEVALREQGWDPDELIWTDPLGVIAQLEWIPDTPSWNSYRREIPLTNGDASVSWALPSGARSGLRVLSTHGIAGFDLEIWSEVETTGLLRLVPVREAASNADTVLPTDYSGAVRSRSVIDSTALTVAVAARGEEPGTATEAVARIHSSNGTVDLVEDGWQVTIASGTRRFRIEIDVVGPDDGTSETIDVDALLRGSALGLPSSDAVDGPTEELWAAAIAGSGPAVARVIEMAYSAGRRNIAISTASLPPTLQGVWQGTWSPAWSADYTLNGNVQLGALAGVLWTGTPVLMTSLFRLVRRYTDHYRSNARRIFGRDGMLLPARMTTHGHANHFLRDYPHQFWSGSGPWFLRLAADYVMVTGDRSIIDEWLWDAAVEILAFSTGIVEDAGGTISPSYSPENTPSGADNPLVTDAAADVAALRDGYRVGIWLAGIRGDPALAAEWTAARDRLPGFAVAADGTLAEWSVGWAENIAHRHASQLQGLWYDPDDAFDGGELREAALRTVRAKVAWRAEDPTGPPGNMEMAFGLSSIGLAAAALGDAGSAYRCALWLARDHFTPALSTTHDAGAIFNLDASGALPAVVAAMLVQSTADRIRLLPALPDEWASGRITGLTARGAVTVSSLVWTDRGVDARLELSPRGVWMHPTGVTVVLPRAGVSQPADGVVQTSPTTVVVAAGVERATIRFDFAGE